VREIPQGSPLIATGAQSAIPRVERREEEEEAERAKGRREREKEKEA
jgi:hypothetical protein